MANIGNAVVQKAVSMLEADTGLAAGLATVSSNSGMPLPMVAGDRILAQQVSFDVLEKAKGAKYPTYTIYCEKLENNLREKFRRFSGTASLCVDVRVTHDRLEGLDELIQLYVDAVLSTLDLGRGDWGEGQYYTGGYTVSYQPVKHGGKNFLQTAKVCFDVQISL
jgi:hypothetical protein